MVECFERKDKIGAKKQQKSFNNYYKDDAKTAVPFLTLCLLMWNRTRDLDSVTIFPYANGGNIEPLSKSMFLIAFRIQSFR